MRKIIFLDIDGVLNCEDTAARMNGIIGIDPFLVMEFNRIIFATDAEIVLSSSWRHSAEEREEIKKKVMPFIDITPTINEKYAVRGDEVEAWLEKNIGKIFDRKDKVKYAILDDDSDFYIWQPLFKTSWKEGLTNEIAQRVIKHLNQEENTDANNQS